MFRLWILLFSAVLVLGTAGNALADDLDWDNSSGDSLWRTAENWRPNQLPGAGDSLYINWRSDPTEIIIDAETNAQCGSVTLSNDASGGQGYVHLHMTGGTLTAGNLIRVGRKELAMFTLDEGDVTCYSFQLGRKDPSKGVAYIKGGTIRVETNTRVPRGGSQGSELHLNGGTLYTGGLVMNDPDDPLSGTNGQLDIAGGVMVLTSEEDQTEKIKGYVQNGWITAYGVKSGELLEDGRMALVQMDFGVNNPGMTTVWASAADPTQARAPAPADGATVQISDVTALSFTAGGHAAWHDIYFGRDQEAVAGADSADTTGIYRGRFDVSGYILPETLEWGATYYWRIDEGEADDAIHAGEVWSFTVADYLLVDDFEQYDTGENQIWYSWKDGVGYGSSGDDLFFAGNGTGASVGDETTDSYAEETEVYGGNKSMPYFYDNGKEGGAGWSQATLTLDYPRDWTEQGVGELSLWFKGHPAYVGGFGEDPAGTYTISASGSDIWDASDQFHFAYKEITGAGTIQARVLSVGHTDDWAKAGVMIRDSLDAGSAHAMLAMTPANGIWFGRRAAAGQSSVSTKLPDLAAPQWVKLERTIGGLVRASYSPDGNTWTPVGTPESVTMNAPIYIGLALTSHNPDATCEAQFSDVTFPGTDVDAGWTDEDVGMIANAPEPMYVAVGDGAGASAVVYHDDPNATVTDDWAHWKIPLRQFADQGVNLTDVDEIAIGFGDSGAPGQTGGSGKMYFDDIRLYRLPEEPEEIVTVQWLGHSTVKIWSEDRVVYVDPERVSQSLHDATVVCVTHTHGDHYSPSDIAKVSNDQTIFIGPPDVVQRYGGGRTIAPGQTIQLDGVAISAVHSYNTNKPNHPKSRNWVGYVVELASRRIYVAGDTDLIDEMKTLGHIDVAFLPAGGTYTMNAVEAADATQCVKPGLAIPYHWGQSVGNLSDAQTFVNLASSDAQVLTVNESISSDNWPEYSPLLAHWPLDEAQGDIAFDILGDNDGTVHGAAAWRPASGRAGGALEFGGLDDYVGTGSVLNPAHGSFSVFAWVKGGGPGQAIISQTGEAGQTWLSAEPVAGSLMTGLVPPAAGRSVTEALVSEFVITDGSWHHVGLVWDGSLRRLYADGAEVAADVGAIPALESASGGLHIGASENLEPAGFWRGLIDDVRIYRLALSTDEIRELAQ
ncbi:MAG: MBL fold metallo-hydrolase [Planctomycetota bacterium]|jgi:L-ascorbate metabolism protein UlaG (beta-lactamase superfamily)